jgi:sarcosine oxidase
MASAASAKSANAAAASSAAASPSAEVFDVIVIGVGAMGSATCYHLAKRGNVRVLGLERFDSVGHNFGSSHGETRITRMAYWEDARYVPLLARSFELYSELEKESQAELFVRTGSVDIGPENEATFQGSVASCVQHGLEHEIMTPQQLAKRFPGWRVPDNYRACFQPAGGMLRPERMVAAHARMARKHGAVIRELCEVVDIRINPTDDLVSVVSSSGEVFRGRRVVLCAGGWLPTLLPRTSVGLASPRLRALASLLRPERQVVSWYPPSAEAASDGRFDPSKFPVWISTLDGAHYYGFPLLAGGTPGLKIGRYHHRYEQLSEADLNDTETRARTDERDRDLTRDFMARMLVGVSGTAPGSAREGTHAQQQASQQTCVFTNSPDEHFILDRLVDVSYPQVVFVSACSGHGFKFSPAIGEAVAEMAMREVHEPRGSREQVVEWLGAGRLLGDRPPFPKLDAHAVVVVGTHKEQQQLKAKL